MIRRHKKHANGLGSMEFDMEMDRERGEFESAFPAELPAGHHLVYRWSGRTITFDIVPAPQRQPPSDDEHVAPGTRLISDPTQVKPAAEDATERQKLEALPEAERLTQAAEAQVKNLKKIKDGGTAAAQAAAILEARKAKPAAK